MSDDPTTQADMERASRVMTDAVIRDGEDVKRLIALGMVTERERVLDAYHQLIVNDECKCIQCLRESVEDEPEDGRDPLWDHCTGCKAWAGEPCSCGDDDYDAAAEWHDAQHPVWNEGCDECLERANQIEAER